MSGVSSYAIAVILCLQTVIGCLGSTIGQYIYAFYLQTYPFYFDGISNSTLVTIPSYLHKINKNSPEKCTKSNLSLDSTAQAWAQQKSADLFFCPPFFYADTHNNRQQFL